MHSNDPSATDQASVSAEQTSANPSPPDQPSSPPGKGLEPQKTDLAQQVQALKQEILDLQTTKAQLLQNQLAQAQSRVERFAQESLRDLEQRKQSLQITVDQLERRQERIQAEMRRSFAGVSQDLAIRVQGFKDYLVNSLQDLVVVSEQLDLVPPAPQPQPTPALSPTEPEQQSRPQFAEQEFQEQIRRIRQLLDQYRNSPNYYGPPWQLRRTFEPVHAERVADWFFTLGGRGALRSLGSCLQNILVASAAISVLRDIYGHRLRTLILANSPERLGDWRRGLQECLGISRTDFGPERGIVLFESSESLAQKADRLIQDEQLPLILFDNSEEQVSLFMLQYPLWLGFASEPQLRTGRPGSGFFDDFFE